MQLTQQQIDEMDSTEMLSNIALAFEEQREKIKDLKEENEEFKPMLKEVLESNVEIVEEEEEEVSERTVEATLVSNSNNPQ